VPAQALRGLANSGSSRLARSALNGREGAIGDQGFAAHLQPLRRIVQQQAQGHALDCAHIGGDLLAGFAVAAAGGPHQHATLVAQGQGVAVDLKFAHHRQRCGGFPEGSGPIEHLQQPPVPGLQLFA